MIRSILTTAAILSLGVSAPAFAKAAPCRDAKGHFTKCDPHAAVMGRGDVTRDAKGRCHVASGPKRGQFTKCP